MLWETLAFISGISIGIITGLLPGLHINLVSSFVSATVISSLYPRAGAIFIVSLAITHTLIDFIPSIYLGAAGEDTFLTVLPGHALLREGEGFEAVSIAMIGCLCGILLGAIFSLTFTPVISLLDTKMNQYIPWILIFLSGYLIFREDKPLRALSIFCVAGFLGICALNLPVREPLLPLLSGLFGISTLLVSLNNKIPIPQQNTKLIIKKPKRNQIIKTLSALIVIGPIFSFLPALGSGYGSFIVSEATKQTKRGFLFISGCMNALIMTFSVSIIATIGKARTGAAAGIFKVLGSKLQDDLPILLGSALLAGVCAFGIGLLISKKSVEILQKTNYSKISLGVIVFVLISITLISGIIGVYIGLTATALGVMTSSLRIKRTNLMGALIIPTLLYYLL